MNEESVIFGAKRHLYGGIEPDNMTEFSVRRDGETMKIIAGFPSDTIISDKTLATVAGVKIMRKAGAYPENEFDGELVADLKYSKVLTLPDDGGEYMYAAFPYSTQGVYNRNKKNHARVLNQDIWHFGYDVDMDDPNPNTRVSYPSDVDNYGFTPMTTTREGFAGSSVGYYVLDYGSWFNTGGIFFMPKPVVLNWQTGSTVYTLNDNDYTKTTGGTDVSTKINDSTTNYDVMLRWPKIYVARYIEDGIYKFRCSNIKLGAEYECWSNYDINNHEIPFFYMSAYPASRFDTEIDGKSQSIPRSLSGSTKSSFYNTGTSGYYSYCRTKGPDWCISQYCDWLLTRDLLTMILKSTLMTHEKPFGYHKSVEDTGCMTGMANTKGLFTTGIDNSGDVSSRANYLSKIFGIEAWMYSNRRGNSDGNGLMAGLLAYRGRIYYKLTRGTKDGSTAMDYCNVSGYSPIDPARDGLIDSYNQFKDLAYSPEQSGERRYSRVHVENGAVMPVADNIASSTTYYSMGIYLTSSALSQTTIISYPFAINKSMNALYAYNSFPGDSGYSFMTHLSYKPSV